MTTDDDWAERWERIVREDLADLGEANDAALESSSPDASSPGSSATRAEATRAEATGGPQTAGSNDVVRELEDRAGSSIPASSLGSGPRDWTPAPEDDSWEPVLDVDSGPVDHRAPYAGAVALLALVACVISALSGRTSGWLTVALGAVGFISAAAAAYFASPRHREDPYDDGARL